MLTFRSLTLTAVRPPVPRPLITKVVTISEAPLLLIDLETEEGITGRAYLVGYMPGGPRFFAPVLRDIEARLKGQPLAPARQFAELVDAYTLMGRQGIATVAISGFDMAAWDAIARAHGVPLAELLGGRPDPVKAYNSNGLGIIEPQAAAEEALALLAEGGFGMVKARVGRDRLADDLAALDAIRDAIGPDIRLPVDFNQSLDVPEAIRRGHAFDERDIYWIEEPVVYDDLAGQARIAADVATPIQIGENLYGPRHVADVLAAGAADYLMPDAMRIGGVTGWLRAAALADAAAVPLSSHLFPEFSAHLLNVTPTRHYLEYMNWADPILAEPYAVRDGHVHIPDRPGVGLEWDAAAVRKYRIDL